MVERRKKDPERMARAIQMLRDNIPFKDIVEATGYEIDYLRCLASRKKIKRKRISIRDYGDQIMFMEEQGKTYDEIGEAIGYSPISVKNYIGDRKRKEKLAPQNEAESLDEDIMEIAFPQEQLSFAEHRVVETPIVVCEGRRWRDVTALYCPN